MLSTFLLSTALADMCPSDPSAELPAGWHCSGHNCQEGTFIEASFSGYEKFGAVTCFYDNKGVKFSVHAWVSGGTVGEYWHPNTQGKRCSESIEACEFGQVQTE